VPRSNRLSLSIASTAVVALASLPLGITPASAARVSEGTTSSIGVIETSSDAQQFNLGNSGVQAASTDLVASRGGNDGVLLQVFGLLPKKLQRCLTAAFLFPEKTYIECF
jgi:hypothetical protein